MGGLFGGGKKQSQAAETPAVSTLQVSTSAYGIARPWVRGTARISGNMLWYGDFTSYAHESGGGGGGGKGGGGGGGGGGGTTYTYSASFLEGLCEGPIFGIGKAWVGKSETTVAAMGGTVITGQHGQAPWPYLASAHPEAAVSYSGLAYVGLPNYDLGDSSSTPNLSFEVQTASQFGGGIVDQLPSVIVSDFLIDSGFPASKIGDLSAYATYCQALGLFFSPALTEQQAANSTLQDWATATGSEFVWSSGKLHIIPYGTDEITGYGATYSPDLTPMYDLTDDDFVRDGDDDPIICTRSDLGDAYNQYKVEFHSRANAYNVATTSVDDQAHIDTYGLRPAPVVKAHEIKDEATAQLVGRLVMARNLYVRATYEFKLTWKHCRLDAMDLVTLTDEALGLDRELVRIVEIEEDEDGLLSVKAEEVPGVISAPARYSVQSTDAYSVNINESAGDTNPPVIFEPPGAITDTGLEVWIAASGGPIWGGAEVWVSQDGDTYSRVGSITAPSRHGVLAGPLAVGDATDNVNILSVDLSMSRGSLGGASAADAQSLNSLCYVDGELLAYTDAELTNSYTYALTGLVRGAYGTTISHHARGSQFARLDGAVFRYPFLAEQIGKTFYIKLLSFNVWGSAVQSLADVEPYTYTPTGWSPPSDPTNLYLTNGNVVWEQPKRDTDLAGWRVRQIAGKSRNWSQGADYPADGSPVTLPSIPVSIFGSGVRTIMVRAVDTLGNLSTGALFLTLGLGEASPSNLILTYDEKAEGFPGTITGGSVDEDGNLVADTSGDLLLPDNNALLLPIVNDLLLPGAWGQMVYDFTYTPAYADAPGTLLLDNSVFGDGWQLLYRRRGTTGLLLQNDDEALLPDEGALLLDGPQPFSAWPGTLDYRKREKIDFRVVTEAGSRRGIISALAVKIDVPDVTESFQDLAIAPGGTRLPLTNTYRVIDYIGTITVQDTGTGAAYPVVIDKNPTLGPLIEVRNSSGTSVAAVIDIQDIKGH